MACEVELSALFPKDVYIQVGVANPLVNNGVAVQVDDQSFTIQGYAGWETRLIRNGTPQFLGNPNNGDSYFDYTSISGEFTLSQKVIDDQERFICQAYKPS